MSDASNIKQERGPAGLGGGDDEPPYKKTCLRSSLDPDVIIIVGGREFQEYSQTLCPWSEYFDAALKSRTKGSKRAKFVFLHRDPDEWEWILSLFTPFPSTGLSKDNVHTALSWFQELRSPVGLQACDSFYSQNLLDNSVLSNPSRWPNLNMARQHIGVRQDLKTELAQSLRTLATSKQYGLEETKASCYTTIQRALRDGPFLFEREQLVNLISLLGNEEGENMEKAWEAIKRYLPEPLSSQPLDVLAGAANVPLLILSEIRFFEAMHSVSSLADETIANVNSKEKFLKSIRGDELCGRYCAKEGQDDGASLPSPLFLRRGVSRGGGLTKLAHLFSQK